ncbi:MAG: exodeoxyribonuclease VII large subunit [Saprospiraceae bacterium]|nr:exodeoxyribonuclease VII large subunit [Saprospiraceae bacterium]
MFSLFELNEHLRRVVALNFPQPVWIRAEIAQIGESKGHYYLDLVQKDEDSAEILAQAQAALWSGEYRQLLRRLGPLLVSVLREGQTVKLQVRPDFHERYGFKLHISDVDPAFTLGLLDLQRRQTVQFLKEQGLFDLNRNMPLPPVIQRIALISSETAAGKQDFMRQLTDNQFGYRFNVTFFQAAVQGKDAGPEIMSALKKIAAQAPNFDAVVLVRGGGARLDLSAFDALDICAETAQMPLPVLAGIGHDIDETVLDLVACRSLKTPTAVAEYILQHNLLFEGGIIELTDAIGSLASAMLKSREIALEQCLTETRWAAKQVLRHADTQVQMLHRQTPQLARQLIQKRLLAVEQAQVFCQALHPDNILRRGFSITYVHGKAVISPEQVQPGDIVETRLKDGVLKTRKG